MRAECLFSSTALTRRDPLRSTLPATGADWYSGNLHKWAHAPRSCGILWAKPEHQARSVTRSCPGDRVADFMRNSSTRPRSIRRAISPRRKGLRSCASGISTRSSATCTGSRMGSGRRPCRVQWGTTLDAASDMIGAMVTVPLPEEAGSTTDEATTPAAGAACRGSHRGARPRLARTVVGARLVQVYNDRSDVDRLAEAVVRRVRVFS